IRDEDVSRNGANLQSAVNGVMPAGCISEVLEQMQPDGERIAGPSIRREARLDVAVGARGEE
ncbi:MAG TPA: hypothetical protein VJR92_16135, partial [Gemmatimonadaceae bacterium]|nr:hypothetical protein [Gemmatimonadaceae bacterium]